MSLSRRTLREICMKLAYQYDFYENPELLSQVDNYFETEDYEESEMVQIKTRVSDLYNHIPEIDAVIEEKSDGWKIKRMSKVDLSLLRLAVYEIKFDEDVPESVAINEAVELAKIYGGDHSYQFVNGVLSKIVK